MVFHLAHLSLFLLLTLRFLLFPFLFAHLPALPWKDLLDGGQHLLRVKRLYYPPCRASTLSFFLFVI